MKIEEGYYNCEISRSKDCDHGPCTEYVVVDLGIRFYLYDNELTLVSFHEEKRTKSSIELFQSKEKI
tara:strand:- start:1512 stop:1712 length:201 start_codon:yes stop_codon:yes gene_type:complete